MTPKEKQELVSMISEKCNYSGEDVFELFTEVLTDINFHAESRAVKKLAEEMLSED